MDTGYLVNMKIYELIYIWDDPNGYELTETNLLIDYTEVEKEIELFCKGAENNEGILTVKEKNCITYEFNDGFSILHIKEHNLCV